MSAAAFRTNPFEHIVDRFRLESRRDIHRRDGGIREAECSPASVAVEVYVHILAGMTVSLSVADLIFSHSASILYRVDYMARFKKVQHPRYTRFLKCAEDFLKFSEAERCVGAYYFA